MTRDEAIARIMGVGCRDGAPNSYNAKQHADEMVTTLEAVGVLTFGPPPQRMNRNEAIERLARAAQKHQGSTFSFGILRQNAERRLDELIALGIITLDPPPKRSKAAVVLYDAHPQGHSGYYAFVYDDMRQARELCVGTATPQPIAIVEVEFAPGDGISATDTRFDARSSIHPGTPPLGPTGFYQPDGEKT